MDEHKRKERNKETKKQINKQVDKQQKRTHKLHSNTQILQNESIDAQMNNRSKQTNRQTKAQKSIAYKRYKIISSSKKERNQP